MNFRSSAAAAGRAAASPLEDYERKRADGSFVADAAQRRAAEALENVYRALLAQPPHRYFRRRRKWPPVSGLYLWGGVGRGKTSLMDSFYVTLPFSHKQRTHFHRFMLGIQHILDHHRDEQDPLLEVATDIASRTRVLCFDEFQVFDIADAMILGRLFDGLFERGVTLVATSNVAPDDLYRDGLQREQFLPAIAALKRHCTILNVGGGTDFRLRALHQAPIYLCPADARAEEQLTQLFERIAGHTIAQNQKLRIQGRAIRAKRVTAAAAWFAFQDLCEGPRGTADYVELANTYPTVFISGVPKFDAWHEAAARRFINLVDEFYDRHVKLILSAAGRPAQLYSGVRLGFEFERTCSRLLEMQSREYLTAPHSA